MDSVIISTLLKAYRMIRQILLNSFAYLLFNKMGTGIMTILNGSRVYRFMTSYATSESQEASGSIMGFLEKIRSLVQALLDRYAEKVKTLLMSSKIVSGLFYFYSSLLYHSTRSISLMLFAYVLADAVCKLTFGGNFAQNTLYLRGAAIIAGSILFFVNTPLIAIINSSFFARLFLGLFDREKLEKKPDMESMAGKPAVPLIYLFFGVMAGIFAAVLPFKYAVVAFGAMAGVPLLLYSPYISVLATVALFPFMQTMMVVGAVFVTFFSFTANLLAGRVRLKPLNRLSLYILIFAVVLMVIGAAVSNTMVDSLKIALIYCTYILFFFLFVNLVDTKTKWQVMVRSLVLFSVPVVLFGLYQYITGNVANTWMDESKFEGLRIYSFFENPNVYGGYLLLVAPLCIGFLWAGIRKTGKLAYFMITGALVLSMLLTQARGCWIGFLGVCIVFALFADRRMLAFGLLILFMVPFVLPEFIVNRFLSIGDLTDSSTNYRFFIWIGSLAMLKDYWFSGVGLGQAAFNTVYPQYALSDTVAPHAHNLYMVILSETGFVGLLVFMLIILNVMRRLLTLNVHLQQHKERLHKEYNAKHTVVMAACILGAIVGFLLDGMTDNMFYNYRIVFMFYAFIAMALTFYQLEKGSIEHQIHQCQENEIECRNI